jgi:hypothetical protein
LILIPTATMVVNTQNFNQGNKMTYNLDRHTFYNKLGEEIDMNKWASYYDSPDYFNVARSKVGEVEIVTEWTGIGEQGCIFQTIVRTRTQIIDVLTAKTEKEAMINHALMREKSKMSQKLDKKASKSI